MGIRFGPRPMIQIMHHNQSTFACFRSLWHQSGMRPQEIPHRFSREIIFSLNGFTAQLCDSPESKRIAYELRYSTVAHLSGQFKKVTGMTPTAFRKLTQHRRNSLDQVGKSKWWKPLPRSYNKISWLSLFFVWSCLKFSAAAEKPTFWLQLKPNFYFIAALRSQNLVQSGGKRCVL